jgi:sugar phosphate permease
VAQRGVPRLRPETYRWLVFGLLAGAYFMVYFHRTSPAVVALDLMAELKAGSALLGLLGSAYFYPYALMQLPAGLLSDSWGPRRTVTAFFVLAGLGSIFFGLAGSAPWAILARVLVGLGVSMVFVATMKILTGWFAPAQFARMMGLLMAVGGLGALGSAGPLAYLSGWLGWRGAFLAMGLATLVLSLALWRLVRDRPEELGYPALVGPLAATAPAEPIGLWQGVRMVLGEWRFWPLAVWFGLGNSIFFAFGGLWGGPYLTHVHGLSRTEAGQVLSSLAVGLILGSPLLSHLSDKVFRSRKKLIVTGAAMVLVLTVVLTFWGHRLPLPALYLWCFLLAIFGSAIVVVGFTATKELFPLQIAGTATGLVNLFPFLGGAGLQVLVGYILEGQAKVGQAYPAAAYRQAFSVFLVASAISFVFALLVKETLGRDKEEA